jgi:hypothetical protein
MAGNAAAYLPSTNRELSVKVHVSQLRLIQFGAARWPAVAVCVVC